MVFPDDFYGLILCMTIDKLSVIMMLFVDKTYCDEMILSVFGLKCFITIKYSDIMENKKTLFTRFLRPLYLENTKT